MVRTLILACAAATTLAFAPMTSPAVRSMTQRSAADYFNLGAGEKTAAMDASFMAYLQMEAQEAQKLTNDTSIIGNVDSPDPRAVARALAAPPRRRALPGMPTLTYPSANPGFQLTTPYFGDSSAGFIESPISSSMMTKMILGNLAAYRPGLTSKARGLEIGLAHGYLFFGPFFKLGPMRGSPVADYVGLMATMAFMLLLTMALTAYTYLNEDEEPSLFTKEFNGGFLVGGWGSAVFAFLIVHANTWLPVVNTPTFQVPL